jgi:membrane-associated phospholipid phosphatase
MKKITLLFILIVIQYTLFAQSWNYDVLKKINIERNTALDKPFKAITNSASPMAFGVPAILYTVGLLKKDSVLKQKAIYIGTTVVVSSLITAILKKTIKEDRPHTTYPDIQNITSGGSYSFPSGHTSDAFALATSISVAYPKWYIIAPSFTWASAVGYSRMHLGVHYPKDVIAGAIVGSGSAYLSYKLNKWLFSPKKKYASKYLQTN